MRSVEKREGGPPCLPPGFDNSGSLAEFPIPLSPELPQSASACKEGCRHGSPS